MIVKVSHKANIIEMYRWLETNVGLYGDGWKIFYNDPRTNTGLESMYNDLDIYSSEDAAAFSLKFGTIHETSKAIS